jgi:hypothetical protein
MKNPDDYVFLKISEEYGFKAQGAIKPDKTLVTDEVLMEVFDGLSNSGANFLEDMRPMIDNYGNYVTKIKLALLANCGFVNYNIEDNAKLGDLIKTGVQTSLRAELEALEEEKED